MAPPVGAVYDRAFVPIGCEKCAVIDRAYRRSHLTFDNYGNVSPLVYASAMHLPLLILFTLLISTSVAAQWINYPTAGVPRKADGSVNMTAPTPRLADGKPDFSGIWTTAEPNRPTEGLSSPGNQAAGRAPIVDDK